MDNKYKFITVAYKLYTIENDVREMEEEAPAEQPFAFISGFGTTIPGFEANIAPLNAGDDFDFTLNTEEAYGEHYAERVLDLDKNIFCIDGKFDTENIFVDAIIPLQNEDGNRFMGHVLEIGETTIKIDLNHPLAGKKLNFVGKVVESREATNKEIEAMINRLSGGCGGCGGGCHGGCGGNCGDGCGGNCEGGCDGDCNCK